MNLLSSTALKYSATSRTLRNRCTADCRNAPTMKEEIRFSSCEKAIAVQTRRVPFRLPLEAKAVTILVLFAAAVSISRTCTLLRNFDTSSANRLRSLHMGQRRVSLKLQFQAQPIYLAQSRVVYWNERSTLSLLSKKRNSTKITEKYSDEPYDHYLIDPTRRYDQSDSEDLPTLEQPQWPNHEFDPHCQPAASWQRTFHPTCNEIHAGVDIQQVLIDREFSLLSSKGYWRHAWLYQTEAKRSNIMKFTFPASKTVWKTLK
jgi:hypothetical protein